MKLQFRHDNNIEPSYAERLIIKELKEREIEFYREVKFEYCRNPTTGAHLRYDFYLPAHKILIEYDGIESHSSFDVKLRDSVKDKFAADNKIKLIRISGLSYIPVFFRDYLKSKISEIVKQTDDIKPFKKKYWVNQEVNRLIEIKKTSIPKFMAAVNRLNFRIRNKVLDKLVAKGIYSYSKNSEPTDERSVANQA